MKKKSTEEDPLDEFRYPDGMYDIPTIVSFFGRKRHQKHTFEEIHKEVCDLLEIECAFTPLSPETVIEAIKVINLLKTLY